MWLPPVRTSERFTKAFPQVIGNDKSDLIFYIFFQLHAVSRVYPDWHGEPSVKTLRSPLSIEFWRHYVLSGETQRCRTLPRLGIKLLNY